MTGGYSYDDIAVLKAEADEDLAAAMPIIVEA